MYAHLTVMKLWRGLIGLDALQANFATPPDGSRPRMRMYSWSGTQPYRDGDFEAGIGELALRFIAAGKLLTMKPSVIHEYSHGLSTRLTGGPANCETLVLDVLCCS